MTWAHVRRGLALAGLLVLLSLPFWGNAYILRIATGIFLWAGLACAWNIVGGYAGYISFGHSAFFGIGAYAAGILMGERFGLPFAGALVVGVAAAGVVAALIGWPTLRLRGAYFAIATWAFAEMVLQLANVLRITGGTAGLTLPPLLDERLFYFLMLGGAVLTYGLCFVLLERSRFGYRLKAIRDNEIAAETLGIDTTRVKLQAFVLSAAITAAFGAIYAYWITFINPTSVLAGDITDQMVVMALLGGLGHLWGPAIGAASMYLVNRLFWSLWGNTTAYIVVLGVVIALVVLFLPDGLVSLWPRTRRLQVLRALGPHPQQERPTVAEEQR
ncbi:branched-chain amino acid ABC transporter permease [Thermorudis peleae]|uniref:branched-chain amino acid ABC transporter permease n=1 Tax=Thermorudis peleae TaxID=1382356 RepID=UPI0006912314|nr:branched-chain amino acid ABC transporter permease [Thermorudis peleae]MBX6754473.1 branched-chain amino acid ABC transporter permease [Thermorudis peleae]